MLERISSAGLISEVLHGAFGGTWLLLVSFGFNYRLLPRIDSSPLLYGRFVLRSNPALLRINTSVSATTLIIPVRSN